ncbi:MAG TPA: hypothetical protein VGF55_00785 [Gemmataceae bacterium]|jgi:hypothetical protein
MATTTSRPTEADILEQVIAPRAADLSPEAARSLLALSFDRPTTSYIRQLLQRNNRGTITTDERIALERYLRVGQLLDLLHAKARLSLKESAPPR